MCKDTARELVTGHIYWNHFLYIFSYSMCSISKTTKTKKRKIGCWQASNVHNNKKITIFTVLRKIFCLKIFFPVKSQNYICYVQYYLQSLWTRRNGWDLLALYSCQELANLTVNSPCNTKKYHMLTCKYWSMPNTIQNTVRKKFACYLEVLYAKSVSMSWPCPMKNMFPNIYTSMIFGVQNFIAIKMWK